MADTRATNLGTDLSLADGFQRTFPVKSGRANLVEAIFRRCSTSAQSEAGQAIYEGKCVDIRDYFAARMSRSRMPQIERALETACLYDDRIDGATCRAQFNFSQKRLECFINLEPADGSTPFEFVIATDGVTPELLNGNA